MEKERNFRLEPAGLNRFFEALECFSLEQRALYSFVGGLCNSVIVVVVSTLIFHAFNSFCGNL